MINYDNWHLKIFLSEAVVPYFEQALDGTASALLASKVEAGAHRGKWFFEAIFEKRPDMAQLETALAIAASMAGIEVPDYTIGALPNKNWLKESLLSFPPVNVGKFYIYGSHIKVPPPKGKIALKIDAATAFGSGEHPTTEGCLQAIHDLKKAKESPMRILDMGCGSGILSLAAASVFKVPVRAVDIDPESARLTNENVKINKLDKYIEARKGSGYRLGFVKDGGPYDMILANILAKPLIRMAPSLYKNLAKGGVAVLSGLLERQEEWVLKAHTKLGLKVEKIYHINGWSAIVLRKGKR